MTRFYPIGSNAGYAPTTFKGGWTETTRGVTRRFTIDRTALLGSQTAISKTPPAATDGYSECLLRVVSDPLAGGALASGTLDWCFQLSETNAAANAYPRVHAYLTQGDSDAVRATLVSATTDATEFNTGAAGARSGSTPAWTGATSVSGDRLVIEFGYILVAPTTTAALTIFLDGDPTKSDMSAGNTGSQPAWFDVPSIPNAARVSQLVAEGVVAGASAARVSHLVAEGVVAGASAARVSQLVVEAVYSSVVTARTRGQILR